jgi:membrane protein implicated in regulation of membrane protease activity
MNWLLAGILFGIGLILAPLVLGLAILDFVIVGVGGLAIVALIFLFTDPGAALCLGILLAAWIGKRWLDYRDALVEEQERHIRQLAEEIRRD